MLVGDENIEKSSWDGRKLYVVNPNLLKSSRKKSGKQNYGRKKKKLKRQTRLAADISFQN